MACLVKKEEDWKTIYVDIFVILVKVAREEALEKPCGSKNDRSVGSFKVEVNTMCRFSGMKGSMATSVTASNT